MTNVSELLIPEINITKCREDFTIPLKAVATTKKVKNETLLLNINKFLNKVDTSAIDYTNGGTPANTPLKRLNDLFCDNIIFQYNIDSDEIRAKHQKDTKTSLKVIADATAATVLKEYTPKLCNTLTEIFGTTVNKSSLKPVRIENRTSEPYEYTQLIKFNYSSICVTDVFEMYQNKSPILSKAGFAISDIDFTRDYAGVVNKDSLIDYLINEKTLL